MGQAMVNDMSAKNRLQGLEAKLRERGVVDVKFFFDHTRKPLLTGAVSDVIEVLDAVVGSRFEKAAAFGDSVHAA
ncbi:MAG TPA: hypothetical protein DIC54_14770 [Pseudomonas sp.]|nr:hypothetical protein [Pseudomonas sp.]